MPEGHTIHRLARDIGRDLAGSVVAASSPQGRFADGAAEIDGSVLERMEAHGKHLFGWFDHGVLHVHLGLIGKWRQRDVTEDPVGEIRLRIAGTEWAWDLSGPMTCAIVTPERHDEVTAGLGPDPLRRDGRAAAFVDGLSRRRTALGTALLDQSLVAGIGNVYRAELAFLCGIHPATPAHRIDADDARALWDEMSRLLRIGLKLNRIVTVDPSEVGARSHAKVPSADRLYVYKRAGEPCRRCGTPIERIELAGRKTWFCPADQPEHR